MFLFLPWELYRQMNGTLRFLLYITLNVIECSFHKLFDTFIQVSETILIFSYCYLIALYFMLCRKISWVVIRIVFDNTLKKKITKKTFQLMYNNYETKKNRESVVNCAVKQLNLSGFTFENVMDITFHSTLPIVENR